MQSHANSLARIESNWTLRHFYLFSFMVALNIFWKHTFTMSHKLTIWEGASGTRSKDLKASARARRTQQSPTICRNGEQSDWRGPVRGGLNSSISKLAFVQKCSVCSLCSTDRWLRIGKNWTHCSMRWIRSTGQEGYHERGWTGGHFK